jgi:glycerol kinase
MKLGSALCVIDIGTSSLRAVIVHADATLSHEIRRTLTSTSPFEGAVEFDTVALADDALSAATECIATYGLPVSTVGITCQRASTVLWDARTGEPVAPGIGWQDLRTAGMCLMWNAQDINLAPNQSATKLAFLLDMYDYDRSRSSQGELLFGTVDTWLIWKLSHGSLHITDATNAAVTGLTAISQAAGVAWDESRLSALNIPSAVLASIVDSSGQFGELTAISGSPVLAGIVGDQQASLIGQGCVRPGVAKLTFGTGAMLDTVTGTAPPLAAKRNPAGTFPVVTWRVAGSAMWGAEAIMLSAGTCVEWLRDAMGLITTASESEEVAAGCSDSGGVWFVPALLGLGTPHWDYGARGTLLGVTRGTGRSEIVRSVLEGIAHRGADLVEATEADTKTSLDVLRVDGGMTQNAVFLQALADATQREIEVSPVLEATALGAGFLAGLAVGMWSGFEEIATTWKPKQVVHPRQTLDRQRWAAASYRAQEWLPDLSALNF